MIERMKEYFPTTEERKKINELIDVVNNLTGDVLKTEQDKYRYRTIHTYDGHLELRDDQYRIEYKFNNEWHLWAEYKQCPDTVTAGIIADFFMRDP